MSDQGGPVRWSGSGKRSVRANEAGTPEAEAESTEATDAAKALAAEHGVDLTTVEGSGQEGRVIKDDVEQVVAQEDNA